MAPYDGIYKQTKRIALIYYTHFPRRLPISYNSRAGGFFPKGQLRLHFGQGGLRTVFAAALVRPPFQFPGLLIKPAFQFIFFRLDLRFGVSLLLFLAAVASVPYAGRTGGTCCTATPRITHSIGNRSVPTCRSEMLGDVDNRKHSGVKIQIKKCMNTCRDRKHRNTHNIYQSLNIT